MMGSCLAERKRGVLGVRLAAAALLIGLGGGEFSSASAQQVVNPCTKSDTTYSCTPVSPSNPLPVTPSAPVGTQDTNLKQVNGATVNVGTGAAGTGTQRVSTSTDSTIGTVTTVTNPVTVAQPIAANLNATVVGTGTFAVQEGNSAAILSAIQGPIPVGTNAIGSITNFPSSVATGTGAQGSTVPRTTVATDTATIAGSSPTTALAAAGAGATGSAVPANAAYLGAQASAVLKGITQCDLHAFYDASDNGKKTVVAGVTAKKIYICGFILATGGTATTLSLTSGTGSDCVSTSTAITPAYQLIANDRVGANAAFWNGLVTLATADNLCVNASAGNAHQVEVWYTIQ